uniref:Uncharacterized protein n=1 Tax=Cacopsylla melanoneura TaxID=428564 RepID=A0A8D9FII5_9HEMI
MADVIIHTYVVNGRKTEKIARFSVFRPSLHISRCDLYHRDLSQEGGSYMKLTWPPPRPDMGAGPENWPHSKKRFCNLSLPCKISNSHIKLFRGFQTFTPLAHN